MKKTKKNPFTLLKLLELKFTQFVSKINIYNVCHSEKVKKPLLWLLKYKHIIYFQYNRKIVKKKIFLLPAGKQGAQERKVDMAIKRDQF